MFTADTTQPLAISFDRTRKNVRTVLLWTDDTTVTSALSAINLNQIGYRIDAKNGHVISCKPSFTDGILKHTIIVKFAPFDKDGNSNVTIYSTDGTATSTVSPTYTSS